MAKSRYADESLFDGMHEDAKAYTEKVGGGDKPTTPLMFLDEGTYTMRIWPDIFTSPETGKKKLRAARVIRTHNLPRDMGGRVPCEGDNCRVCGQVKKLEDAKYGKAWQYKGKEEGIVTGYIFKTNVDDSKYLKLKEAAYIVLSPRVFISFQQFIAGLDREDLIQVMNPEIEAKGLKLSFTSGNKGSASWGFDLRDYELPELPIDFDDYPINKVYFDEGEPSASYITDDNLASLRKFVASTIATRSTSFNPDEDDSDRNKSRGRGDDDRAERGSDRGAARGRDRDAGDDRGAERGAARGHGRESEQEGEREGGSSRTTTSRSNRDADDAERGRGRAARDPEPEARRESTRASRDAGDGDHDRRSRGHGADPEDHAERRAGREPNEPAERTTRARAAERDAAAKDDKRVGKREAPARRESAKDKDEPAAKERRVVPIFECPSDDRNLAFGQNPEILDGEMHPDCITCAHEAECQAKTEETKQAGLDKELTDVPH